MSESLRARIAALEAAHEIDPAETEEYRREMYREMIEGRMVPLPPLELIDIEASIEATLEIDRNPPTDPRHYYGPHLQVRLKEGMTWP